MKFACVLIFMFGVWLSGQAQMADWLHDSNLPHSIRTVATDIHGDIYIGGGDLHHPPSVDSVQFELNGIRHMFRHPNLNQLEDWGYVSKVSPKGELLWTRFLFSHGFMYCAGLETDHNGDVLLKGDFMDSLMIGNDTMIRSTGNQRSQSFVARFDAQGQFKWIHLLPVVTQSFLEYQRPVISDQGNSFTIHGFPKQSHLIKLNRQGAVIQRDTAPQFYAYSAFAIDDQENIYCALQPNGRSPNFLINKVTPGGKSQFLAPVDSSSKWMVKRMVTDSVSNIYVYGYFSSPVFKIGTDSITIFRPITFNQRFIAKLDSSGNTLWLKKIATTNAGTLYTDHGFGDMIKGPDHRLLISGDFLGRIQYDQLDHKYVPTSGLERHLFLLFIDLSGNLVRHKIVSGPSHNYSTSLAAGRHDAYYLGGYTPTDSLLCDHLSVNSSGGFLLKIIDGSNLISGIVYQDVNANGQPDQGDIYFNDQVIEVNGLYRSFTDSKGKYHIYVPNGNYTINYPLVPRYFQGSPTSHNAIFNLGKEVDTANDFVLSSTAQVNDLSILITPHGAIRPGFQTHYTLTAANKGSTTLNTDVTVEYDSLLSFVSAASTVSHPSNHSFVWPAGVMNPLAEKSLLFQQKLASNAVLSSVKCHEAEITPLANDTTPLDNADSLCQVVVGSYDPNDKQVAPAGPVTTKFVQDQQWLDYTIRFQNTGTDTAFTVRIIDTLSDMLDIATFETIASSHAYDMTLENDRIVEWTFRNINLVDSGRSYIESQGFVRYQVKPRKDLQEGDKITNSASIYFDFNEPIVTNTVETLIDDDGVSVEEIQMTPARLVVYPNPTRDIIYLNGQSVPPGPYEIVVYDVAGREVLTTNAQLGREDLALNVGGLRKGLYLLSIKGEVQLEGVKFNKE